MMPMIFLGPIAMVLAAISLIYELLIAKTMVELCGHPVIVQATTIAIFITGMGIGSMLQPALTKKWGAMTTLVRIEVVLAASGALALFCIYSLHILYRIYLYPAAFLEDYWIVEPLVQFGLVASLVALGIGILTGFELPLLWEFCESKQHNLLLCFYYTGTLLGTLAFYLMLQIQLEPLLLGTVCGLMNLLVIFGFLRANGKETMRSRYLPLFGSFVLIAFSLAFGPQLSQYQLKNYYYNTFAFESAAAGDLTFFPTAKPRDAMAFLENSPDILRLRSKYHTIDLVPSYDRAKNSVDSGFAVFMNGRFQFSTATEKYYHEAFAHPAMARGSSLPQKVLILGGGDGLLLREILRYRRVAAVDLVDIDPKLIEMAKDHPALANLNKHSLRDERVEVVVGDAFSYLKTTPKTYDIVFIDFTYPYDFDSARLYSLEMFKAVNRVLSDSGKFVLNSPVDYVADTIHQKWRQVLHASFFYAGFPRFSAYNSRQHHFLIAGKPGSNWKTRNEKPPFRLHSRMPRQFKDFQQRPALNLVNSILHPKLIRLKEGFF